MSTANVQAMNQSADQKSFKDEKVKIKEFNKRELGRIILKQCGNEGSVDNEENGSMRRLLQEAIDYLPKEKPDVWRNATVTIYDIMGNSLEITSGRGGNQFFINHNMKGETSIHKKRSAGGCVMS